MIGAPLQGASGALHSDCASLQSDVHVLWIVSNMIAGNGLYSHSRCSKERLVSKTWSMSALAVTQVDLPIRKFGFVGSVLRKTLQTGLSHKGC